MQGSLDYNAITAQMIHVYGNGYSECTEMLISTKSCDIGKYTAKDTEGIGMCLQKNPWESAWFFKKPVEIFELEIVNGGRKRLHMSYTSQEPAVQVKYM